MEPDIKGSSEMVYDTAGKADKIEIVKSKQRRYRPPKT